MAEYGAGWWRPQVQAQFTPFYWGIGLGLGLVGGEMSLNDQPQCERCYGLEPTPAASCDLTTLDRAVVEAAQQLIDNAFLVGDAGAVTAVTSAQSYWTLKDALDKARKARGGK